MLRPYDGVVLHGTWHFFLDPKQRLRQEMINNQNWGTDLGVNADHRAWLSETHDYLKALDPHRLMVGNSACNFQVVTDLLDFHNYYGFPDHYTNWREWVA